MSENETVPPAGGLEGMKELKMPSAMFVAEKPSFDQFMRRVISRLDLAMPAPDERDALGRATHQLWCEHFKKQGFDVGEPWEQMSDATKELYRYVGAGIAAVTMKTAQRLVDQEANRYLSKALRWKAAKHPTNGAHGKQTAP